MKEEIQRKIAESKARFEKQQSEKERRAEERKIAHRQAALEVQEFLAEHVKPKLQEMADAYEESGFSATLTNGVQEDRITGEEFALKYSLGVSTIPKDSKHPKFSQCAIEFQGIVETKAIRIKLGVGEKGDYPCNADTTLSAIEEAIGELSDMHSKNIHWE